MATDQPAADAEPLPVWVLNHAADRWDDRAPVDAVAPETAWREAVDVTDRLSWDPSATEMRPIGERLDKDEVRLHPPTGMALLCSGLEIVTVVDATQDRRFDVVRQAFEIGRDASSANEEGAPTA